MIKDLIDRLVATWPTTIETLALAVQMAVPWLLFFGGLWFAARGGQALIDRWTVPKRRPHAMRTADQRIMDRDVEQLWRRFPDTIPPAAATLPRVQAGQANTSNVRPFVQPADKRPAP